MNLIATYGFSLNLLDGRFALNDGDDQLQSATHFESLQFEGRVMEFCIFRQCSYIVMVFSVFSVFVVSVMALTGIWQSIAIEDNRCRTEGFLAHMLFLSPRFVNVFCHQDGLPASFFIAAEIGLPTTIGWEQQ